MGEIEVIADIGVNHNGDINAATRLIRSAQLAGADYVKFQLWGQGRFPAIENLRMSRTFFEECIKLCNSIGIDWLCTPFDQWAIELLNKKDMKTWKIPSGKVTNFKYLSMINKVNPERVILSTGLCLDYEVKEAIAFLTSKRIDVLYCVSEYPTKPKSVNLNLIAHYKDFTRRGKTGFSDHSGKWLIPVIAASKGAKIIECHITLNQDWPGPDHKASLDTENFKKAVDSIREVEKMEGDNIRRLTQVECDNRENIRKVMED